MTALAAVVAVSVPAEASESDTYHAQAVAEFTEAMGEMADVFAYVEAVDPSMACPVPGSTFVSSFGAPRVGHVHQGVDMMAAFGTPILAPESGIYEQHGVESFYLYGDSGTMYFGTHLGGHLAASGPVTRGQPVGLVSNTGNAIGGAPHLHFEIHPDGGPAVDPYPATLEACSVASTARQEVAVSSGARAGSDAPAPTWPFGIMEIHRWWNENRERITPAEARILTAYLNHVVGHRLANFVAAISIPYEANWDRVAQCESGGNWAINTGNGYYGGVQFSLATWRSVGGTGLPSDNSKAEQIRRAEILRLRSGLGQWPHCGPRWYG